MLNPTYRQKWQDWKSDYRCSRPPVSCKGCGRHYEPHADASVMIFSGCSLISCSNCDKPKTEKLHRNADANGHFGKEPTILFPHVYKRTWRDVACRYIQRFGGSTFMLPTAIDDCEVYLRDPYGEVIATVSSLDLFPPKNYVDLISDNDDIPF